MQTLGEGSPRHVFEHHEAELFVEVAQLDDMRVVEAAGGSGFANEALVRVAAARATRGQA